LILGMVTALMQQVSSAATASVGHLTATESVGHAIRIFKLLEFYYLWVYTFATLSLLTLLNPFIRLWLGPSFVLDMGVVTLICMNFYLVGRRQVCNTFRNALGLYWHDRYRGPVEAAANLVLSLVLLHEIGLAGVFLGTALSMVLLGVWIEPYVLFKHYLHEPLMPYLWARLLELALVCLLAAPLVWLQQQLVDDGLLGLMVLAAVCLVGINGVLVLRYWRSWQLSHAMQIRQLAGTKALLRGRLDGEE
jgi:O-antigen/teichoic acid export membrane protein